MIFKTEDKVYHYESGWGKVISTKGDPLGYPILVEFENGEMKTFTLEGKYEHCQEPSLSFTEYELVKVGFSQNRI